MSVNLSKKMSILERDLKKYTSLFKECKSSFENQNTDTSVNNYLELQRMSEKIVNETRSLPIEFKIPSIEKRVDEKILETGSIDIYVDEDFVLVKLPFILNKKEKGNPKYIKDTLYVYLERYFKQNDHIIFEEEMVIIYEHRYERGYKSYRDHDNIEVNMINDIMTCFFLKDDSPIFLSHFYTSKFNCDKNECFVYLVKKNKFAKFLNKLW